MKIAYFDCFSGASGDMILGALVDLGVDLASIERVINELGISNFRLKKFDVKKNHIKAVKVDVEVWEDDHHRHLSDIIHLVEGGKLSENSKKIIKRVFQRIAEAEAKIHQVPVEKVHFHEVGALDSIIDIIGAVVGLEYLGIKKIYSSAMGLGSGSVKCAHGIIPVPAPATLELMKGFPVNKREIPCELCTPTGAGLVTTLAEFTDLLPDMIIEKIGYGAGTREVKEIPNILRIIQGTEKEKFLTDSVLLIETNIDDMNPEIYSYIIERLFENNAVDVYITPVYMKKGRPGSLLSIIADKKDVNNLLDIIFSESTTLGVRITEVQRKKLERNLEVIDSPFGTITVKAKTRNGNKVFYPEFEECKKIAKKKNISISVIYNYINGLNKHDSS